MRAARLAPLGFLPVVAMVLAGLDDRLPDPLATHWSGSGVANGHQRIVSFALFACGVWLLVWAAFFLVRRRYQIGHWGEPVSPRAQLVRGYSALGLLLAVFASVVVANLDAPTWRDTEVGPIVLLIAAAGAGVGALLGWWLVRRLLDP